MALLQGFNIANVERVKIVTDETTPVTHVFETASSATATPAVSSGQEVEQRVKNAIKAFCARRTSSRATTLSWKISA